MTGGLIFFFLIIYFITGFLCVVFSKPPRNCNKRAKRILFFLIILFWPYHLVHGIVYISKERMRDWLK